VATIDQSLREDTDYPLDATVSSRWDGQERRGYERDLHCALLISTARRDCAAKLGRALSHTELKLDERVVVAYDPQRSRVPLPPLAEAGARIAYAWLRNQRSFRDRRPLLRYGLKTAQFFGLPDGQPTVEADMAGLRVLVSTSDATIARSVYASGDWDPLMVGAVYDALEAYGQPYRGRTFLEVGANFGVYALPAVAEHGFGRAIAYEPDPAAYELLERNIERNGLGLKVKAVNAALSAAAGELTLQLGTHNAGDNRIVDGSNSAASLRSNGSSVVVPACTFDEEVATGNIPLEDLALVWLDVQGHELEVLKGARSLLAAGVPLVIEFATQMGDRAQLRDLADLLADSYEVMVDLGWCGLTNRLRFQPAWAVRLLARGGRDIETDLLLLPGKM
jgi:FkbM family methyltransferase